MNFGIIFGLLAISSTMTGLITEAVKKSATVTKPNLLAGGVSVIVGVVIGIGYIVLNGIGFSFASIASVFVLVIFSWLCAMLGYDKVMQTIGQIKGE